MNLASYGRPGNPVNAGFCALAPGRGRAFRRPETMPALGDLLARHSPLLLIDAASARIQAARLDAAGPARWAQAEGDAGTALFRCVGRLGLALEDVRAFAFCEGPGSVLGIRTSAMAVRTWTVLAARPVFAFRSLEVVAHALDRRGFSVIADARRDSWHCLTVDLAGKAGPLRRVPTAELAGPLVMPEGFRHWSEPPAAPIERVAYDLSALLPRAMDRDLFRPTDDPDAFLHEEPAYATWTPQVHRAPAPR